MVNWALSSLIFIAVFHSIHFTSQTEGEVAKIQVMFGGSDLASEFSPALPEKGALGPANDLPNGFQTSAGGRSHIAFLQSRDAMFLVLDWFPYPQDEGQEERWSLWCWLPGESGSRGQERYVMGEAW